MKWKIRVDEYTRHGPSETSIQVVKGKSEKVIINKILSLVGREQTSEMSTNVNGSFEWEVYEIETREEFLDIIKNYNGDDDRVVYIYDMDKKEFIYED